MLRVFADTEHGEQHDDRADAAENGRHGGPAVFCKDGFHRDGGDDAAKHVRDLRDADDAAAILLLLIHVRHDRFPVQKHGREEEIIYAERKRIVQDLCRGRCEACGRRRKYEDEAQAEGDRTKQHIGQTSSQLCVRTVGDEPHQRIVDGVPDGVDDHRDADGLGVEAQRIDIEEAEPCADDRAEQTGGEIAAAVQDLAPERKPLAGIGLDKFHMDLLFCRFDRQIEAVQL